MTKQLLLLLLFLSLSTAIYYLIRRSLARKVFLLAVSWVFYCLCSLQAFPILLLEILLAFFSSRLFQKYPQHKKPLLILDLLLVLGTLSLYKYLGFVAASCAGLFRLLALLALPPVTLPAIAVPIGISFFSFVICGYLIDVYRGDTEPETDFVTFALYVSFFPVILSGPIERSNNLLRQMKSLPEYSPFRLREGICRILIGLGKKLLIADHLAVLVNTAFGAPENFTALELLLCACCYSLQIYCDFSAYSDIAIGGGKLLGFELLENFSQPYFSRTIKDFWRSWHKSLTGWFKDYLYIPLGGSRKGRLRTYLNILIVFAVSGLWHGAAWTFVIWGVINGCYQILGDATLRARKRLHSALRLREDSVLLTLWQIVFCFALSTLAWIFFRADSLPQALFYIRSLVTLRGGLHCSLRALGMSFRQSAALCVWLLLLLQFDMRSGKKDLVRAISNRPNLCWVLCTALIFLMIIFGAYGQGYDPQDFVYFKF